MIKKHSLFGKVALVLVVLLIVSAAAVFADHSWGGYHWARTANQFSLKLGDNVSSAWDSYLGIASTDWSISSVLDTQIIRGLTNPKSCKPASGRVEVCSSRYGNNGWLGIAQIWVNGEHITQGTVKMNDFYFNTPTYNTPAWRQSVICQEIGHVFGLDHQDEDFYNPNLGSCMDYTSDPSTNQHPNVHDYAQLEAIYAHLDSVTTVGQSLPNGNRDDINFDDPREWGQAVRQSHDGSNSLYEKDLGHGSKVFTFVVWAR